MATDHVLLWDFDGTLARRPGMWSGALLDILDAEQPGHPFTTAQVRAVLYNGFPWHEPDVAHPQLSDPDAWWRHLADWLTRALIRLGLPTGPASSAAQLMRATYTDPAGWYLFDDTLPALRRLSGAGWRHAVLSNHVPELPQIIAALGIDGFFEAVVNSADTGYEKPHPQAFRAALAALAGPRRVWMIGDNPVADIGGAAAAGIDAILVRAADPGDAAHHAAGLDALLDIVGTAADQ